MRQKSSTGSLTWQVGWMGQSEQELTQTSSFACLAGKQAWLSPLQLCRKRRSTLLLEATRSGTEQIAKGKNKATNLLVCTFKWEVPAYGSSSLLSHQIGLCEKCCFLLLFPIENNSICSNTSQQNINKVLAITREKCSPKLAQYKPKVTLVMHEGSLNLEKKTKSLFPKHLR